MAGVEVTSTVVRKTFVKIPTAITGPMSVKAGFPAGQADSLTLNKAIWNEFGTRGGASGGGWGGPIPERPFMRNAARTNMLSYVNILKSQVSALVTGKTTTRAILSKFGVLMVGDIQKEMASGSFAPNSAVTVERKGSSRPLIDTGEMRQKVTFKVGD